MSLYLTSVAASHIQKHGGFLRVRVKSGGCSGLRYLFILEKEIGPEDCVFEDKGATVLTDALSLSFIGGSTIDYREEMLSSHFVLINPKATNGCGCGDSFSVF